MREHGTRAKYRVEGCRCDACRAASTAYARELNRRHVQAQYGAGEPPLVDSTEARQHIEWLRAHGMGTRRIAELSGVSRSVLRAILGQRCDRTGAKIRPETAAKILAVRPDEENLADAARVPAGATARRLQALIAIGWTRQELARRIGCTSANMRYHLLDDSYLVSVATARRVASIYDELSMTPPPDSLATRRALALARRRGWVPPLEWDDIEEGTLAPTFDDDECAVCADTAHLRFMGETVNEVIAKRLGITRDTLWRHLDRHGRLDLWAEAAS